MMRTTRYSHCIVLFLLLCSCSEKRYRDALSPEESMKTFQLAEGFSIEPFVTEPLVKTPVSMLFDEQGDVYVVEMEDYPYNAEPGQGKGVIRALFDMDGDGRIDSSVVFADRLPSATSMLPWKGGLIVAAAPDILYLKDTSGDYRADIKEVLFTGFFASNSEAQITSLTFGVDNWIYANNNGQHGEVSFLKKPGDPPLNMSGSDFRFRLDRGQFEKESGSGQFGLAMDDWGNRFYTQNTLHIQQSPVPWRYLHRHDFLPSGSTGVNISDHDLLMFQKTPAPYWRAERSAQRQKAFDEAKLDRKEYADGHFTGASGGTFYGGDAFPPEYYGSVFTGDVAGNLVHRDVIAPRTDDLPFVAKRGTGGESREFLASTDPWFRPVNFYSAPDGNLYIVDMYRQHIETPVSIPEELKKDMDFSNGDQMGRIYRVASAGKKVNTAKPGLRNKTSAALVEVLSQPNQWWRLQAQRLLIERHDSTVIPLLKTLFNTHQDARIRLHALYTLEGLDALDFMVVGQALKDTEPGVRKHAMMLAEKYPQSIGQLLQMVNDPSVQVALQATLSLGEFSSPQVMGAFADVIQQRGNNPWFQKAVLSSHAGSSPALLKILIDKNIFSGSAEESRLSFVKDMCYVIAARGKKDEVQEALEWLAHHASKVGSAYRLAGLEGLADGLKQSKSKEKNDPGFIKKLKDYRESAPEDVKTALQKISAAAGDTL
ncbi:MAG: dehydrogenase [Chitinophagaceae bacterium]|nr:dehydrogenase [Chitinophagaceae bacterium]